MEDKQLKTPLVTPGGQATSTDSGASGGLQGSNNSSNFSVRNSSLFSDQGKSWIERARDSFQLGKERSAGIVTAQSDAIAVRKLDGEPKLSAAKEEVVDGPPCCPCM